MSTAYESITVSSSAIGITASLVNTKHRYALITVETADIRFRTDGTAPTSSEGHILAIGSVLELNDHDEIANFKAIRKDAADATIRVTVSDGGS